MTASILTIADEEIPHGKIDVRIEDTISHILEPEDDEKLLISYNIPVRSYAVSDNVITIL